MWLMPPMDQQLQFNASFNKLWYAQSISVFGSIITREALPITAVLMLAAGPAQIGLLAADVGAPEVTGTHELEL